MTEEDKYEVLEKIGMISTRSTIHCYVRMANSQKDMAPSESSAKSDASRTDTYGRR